MNVTGIILYQWLSIPEDLHKMSKSMHIKVIVIETTSFEGRMWDLIVSVPDHCLSFYFFLFRFRTENRIVKDSFSVIMCCYARYLLKICSEGEIKFEIFVLVIF